MRILALDASTKCGWALFENGAYARSGALPQIKVEDFNVNAEPNHSRFYPYNVVDAARQVAVKVGNLVGETGPDVVVVENTVRGRNRNTQRLLEFCHLEILRMLRNAVPVVYMDPSEWRKIVDMRLSVADKVNNKAVSAGKKRGRIKQKHLSVRMVNELYGLDLILKDNDQADAILLGLAYVTRSQKTK